MLTEDAHGSQNGRFSRTDGGIHGMPIIARRALSPSIPGALRALRARGLTLSATRARGLPFKNAERAAANFVSHLWGAPYS
jgi:hypothetical protein